MSIFRKDRDKPEDAVNQLNTPAQGEEYTDITAVAAQNAPAPEAEGAEMEEIYSTRDKQVKYKRQTPIEAEAAAKRQAQTKEELIKGKLEFSSDTDPVVPEMELKAELDSDTVVADDIIEDVQSVHNLRGIYVQDIDDIDISLDPMESVEAYERKAGDKERYEARRADAPAEPEPYVYKGDKVVATVPVYRHDSKVDKIYLKAGRFTDVVEGEYDEYLKSTDPTISKNYHAMQKEIKPKQSLLYTLSQMAQKRKEEAEQQKAQEAVRENFDEVVEKPKKKTSKAGRFFRIAGTLIAESFVAPPSEQDEHRADYNSREDEEFVLGKIRESIKKLSLRTALFAVLSAVLTVLSIAERSGAFNASNAILYTGITLIVTVALGVIGRLQIADGIRPLRRFKGNSETAAALAYCACLIQSVTALFTAASFTDGSHHLYSFIAAFALLLNTIGHLLISVRVKRNFRFITSRSPAYAAKIYNDEEAARRMVSGTTASKGVLAYQHVTRFLCDYLKISYAPDPSEEIAGKIIPITTTVSLFVAVTYAVVFGSVPGVISALAAMLCVSVPFTALLAGNLPMLTFSKKMLSEGAMVAGYPSVRQFCDTSAVMLNACELFPQGSVTLEEMEPLQQYRVEENLLMAAAVLKEAMSPIAPVFDELILENDHFIPSVESVMYEDKSGLVGWIGGERILIGNAALMNRYHISIPEEEPVKPGRFHTRAVTYIARSGQAVAKLLLSYAAPKTAKAHLQRAERSGLAFVVSSPDPNVTAEMIAEEYELFYRSVKVMAPGYANEIDEVTSRVEEASRAYLATRGRQSSLARAVGGCIGLKSNITLGIAIGMFGLILGLLLCATLVLYASVARLSVVELMIYILFWTVATLIAGLIRKP